MKLYHFGLNSVLCLENINFCVMQQGGIQKYLVLSSVSASAILITQLLQVTSAKRGVTAELSTIQCVLGVPMVMS